MQESKQEVTKVVSRVKMAENLPGVYNLIQMNRNISLEDLLNGTCLLSQRGILLDGRIVSLCAPGKILHRKIVRLEKGSQY